MPASLSVMFGLSVVPPTIYAVAPEVIPHVIRGADGRIEIAFLPGLLAQFHQHRHRVITAGS